MAGLLLPAWVVERVDWIVDRLMNDFILLDTKLRPNPAPPGWHEDYNAYTAFRLGVREAGQIGVADLEKLREFSRRLDGWQQVFESQNGKGGGELLLAGGALLAGFLAGKVTR